MRLYRVFPYDASAAVDQPGGALFVPTGGDNRLGNPDLYHELYLASHAEAAVAETFGRLAVWEPEMLVTAKGSIYALATYELADGTPIADLDDTALLAEMELHPTDVVSRDRRRTQHWARELFTRRRWSGVSWWCYYHPQWTIYALWDVGGLRLASPPEPLHNSHPALRQTAETIVRSLRT